MDKLELVCAVLSRLAKKAKDDDLVEYLDHSSHHSDAFLQGVQSHTKNLSDLDAFTEAHKALTQPGGESRTYSKSELDAMVSASISKALAEAAANREQTFTRSELDDAINSAVAKSLADFQKKQKGAS